MTTTKVKEKARKAKEKAKTKVQAKTQAKCAKASRKALGVLAAILAATLVGCQGTSTPSRSQTLVVRDCSITIYGCGADTNQLATIEIGTQAMSIETSGTETQTATPTQTTDVKPEVAVGVGGSSASTGKGGTTSSGGIGAKIGAAADAVYSAVTGSGGTDDATASTIEKTSAECEGGACEYKPGD